MLYKQCCRYAKVQTEQSTHHRRAAQQGPHLGPVNRVLIWLNAEEKSWIM